MDINVIWTTYVAPILAGISISGIISAVIVAFMKGAFSKFVKKTNVDKVSDDAADKCMKKIKHITFKQSIQPLVESRMKDIEEKVAERYEQALEATEAKYQQLIDIMDKFAAYFDNSIGVMEEDKKALHEAIQSAKIAPSEVESTVVEESIETTANTSVLPDNAVKTVSQVNVVR